MSNDSNYLPWDQDPRNPKNVARANSFRVLQTPQYDTNAQGEVATFRRRFTSPDGYTHTWNPKLGMYEITGNASAAPFSPASSSTSGSSGGPSKNYSGIERNAAEQRRQLRSSYLASLAPLQEQLRQSRVQEAEQGEQYRSSMAGMGIGGALPQSGLQRVLDFYRSQQAGVVGQKAGLEAQLTRGRLGIEQDYANKVRQEALRRAAAYAAKVQAELEKDVSTAFGGGK